MNLKYYFNLLWVVTVVLYQLSCCYLVHTVAFSVSSSISTTFSSSMNDASRGSPHTPDIQNEMESVVKRYFQGVQNKNPEMIRSCFNDVASIRDVCGINDSTRTVSSDILVQRCIDFVTAHPDVVIKFHYGPECGRNSPYWVVVHWYETGTWSHESCNIPPPQSPLPMAVEGQTRFRIDENTKKIAEFIVARTFTEWEKAFLEGGVTSK